MTPRALEGMKIVEYCNMVSGPYCSKLLADMGADVLKIEQPNTGDDSRDAVLFRTTSLIRKRAAFFFI